MKNSEYIDKVRQRCIEYLDDNDISRNAAARSMDINHSRLSQFLNKKYTGDNFGTAKEIAGWLKRQKERSDHEEVLSETIMTRAVRLIQQIARVCHIERDLGVATGEAGVGKTRGCRYYAAQNADVILVEAHVGYTTKAVVKKIHQAVGLDGQGSIFDMFEGIVDQLKGTGRLIIIDEAEHLSYRAHEILRSLFDHTNCGMLLSGMPKLISQLRGNKGEYQQLYSRVAVHTQIPTMKDYPEDAEALVQEALPNSNGVWKDFYEITENPRIMAQLIKRSKQVAATNDRAIDSEVVKEANKYIVT